MKIRTCKRLAGHGSHCSITGRPHQVLGGNHSPSTLHLAPFIVVRIHFGLLIKIDQHRLFRNYLWSLSLLWTSLRRLSILSIVFRTCFTTLGCKSAGWIDFSCDIRLSLCWLRSRRSGWALMRFGRNLQNWNGCCQLEVLCKKKLLNHKHLAKQLMVKKVLKRKFW